MELTLDRLRELLHYDPISGVFTWRVSRRSVRAGDAASSRHHEGYLRVGIDGTEHRLHRLAWLYVHNEWPRHEIDHINGERADNRIENLRDVPRMVNQQNRHRPTAQNLGSSLIGAHYKKATGRFHARISIEGKSVHLGSFRTAREAHEAYLSAKRAHHSGCTL